MRRHRSVLNDLATKMPGAGAGAVIYCSGANDELRRRGFGHNNDRAECDLPAGYQCMRRSAAIANAQTDANQGHTHPDADADVLANRARAVTGGNVVAGQYRSIQCSGYLRLCE